MQKDITIFIKTLIIMLLFPNIINSQLQIQQNVGNMGLYGVYLGLYNSRNIVYVSILFSIVLMCVNEYLGALLILTLGLIWFGLNLYEWIDLPSIKITIDIVSS